MECENKKHPIVEIEGFAASGKQFDLDITIPEDGRDVIYGIVRDCYKNPVCDAVVKLIEVEKGCKEDRKPVSHTFTDKHGEFVFGPLCPRKFYAIEIWANKVEHVKICAKCNREGNCLKGIEIGPCDYFIKKDYRPEKDDYYKENDKEDYKKNYKPCYKEDDKKEYNPCYKEDEKKDNKKECNPCYKEDDEKKDDKKEYNTCYKEDEKKDDKKECKPYYKEDYKEDDNKECNSCCKEDNKKECNPCYRPYRR